MKAPVFEPHEQVAWKPPPEVTIDQWAEANIVIPYGAERGPLKLARTPFAREVLQMATDPDVEEITLMFAAQVCKTLICQLICLYFMAEESESCLHVMPKKDDAISVNCDRYQEIIKASPNLRRLLTGAAHDMTREAIRFSTGGIIHFASAQSPSDLASRAIRILILDECDKYVEFSGREADPIALARERTVTYSNRKIVKASTPLTDRGYVHQEFLAGDQRQHYMPCPICGAFQIMSASQLRKPEDETDPERLIDLGSAWYECEACKGRIEDKDKRRTMRNAVWVPNGARVTSHGQILDPPRSKRRLSYRMSRLYSMWENSSLSHVAAESLRAEKSENVRMNYLNSWLGEVYADKVEELKDAHLRARVQPYASCTVPAGVRVMTAGVDVQEHSLWYVIRGWGAYGSSWLIRFGSVETWEQLALVLGLQRGNPQPYGTPRWVFIDSRYAGRKDEVYAFCRHTGCQAIIGAGGMPMRDYWKLGTVELEDGVKLTRLTLDTNHYKQKLHRAIRLQDGEPGAWNLPNDLQPVYFHHMVAEQRMLEKDPRTLKTKVVWKLVHAHARNEAFDTEVYAYAAASIKSLHDLTGEGPLAPRPEAVSEVTAPASGEAVAAQAVSAPKPAQKSRVHHVRERFFT